MKEPHIQSVQIVGLFKEHSRLMDLKIKYISGDLRYLRYELDPVTYNNLKEVAPPEQINKGLQGLDCHISLSKGEPDRASVIWNTFGEQTTFTFRCSNELQIFLNNLGTVSEVEPTVGLTQAIESITKYRLIIKPVLITFFCLAFIVTMPGNFGDSRGDATGSYDHEMQLMEQIAVPVSTFSQDSDISNHLAPGSIIYSLKSGEVALTFDDGPSPNTARILEILREHEITATFFFIGKQVDRYPEAITAVLDQGSIVGWHSGSHVNMANLTSGEQEKEILSCIPACSAGDYKISLFRPPFGNYNKNTKEILAANGMTMVLWNQDPKDWRAQTPDDIIRAVFSTDPSGSIYDLHETQLTVTALPIIIKELKSRGIKFVSLNSDNHKL